MGRLVGSKGFSQLEGCLGAVAEQWMGGRRSGGTRLEQVGLGRDEDAEASDSGLAHRLDRQLKSDVAKRLLRCADVGSRTGCVLCGYVLCCFLWMCSLHCVHLRMAWNAHCLHWHAIGCRTHSCADSKTAPGGLSRVLLRMDAPPGSIRTSIAGSPPVISSSMGAIISS